MFVIVKNSRGYCGGWGYVGPTLRAANVTAMIYGDRDVAYLYAVLLSRYNPVGFHVEGYKSG